MVSKVLSMLGMAKKAGKVLGGEYLCDKAIKDGRACLVIIASDASPLTQKSVTDACVYYGVKYIIYSTKENLGRFAGGGEKAAASVNDRNFAEAIMKKYSEEISISK